MVYPSVSSPLLIESHSTRYMGSEKIHPSQIGLNEIILDPHNYIAIQTGDVIGLTWEQYGAVDFDTVSCSNHEPTRCVVHVQTYRILSNNNVVSSPICCNALIITTYLLSFYFQSIVHSTSVPCQRSCDLDSVATYFLGTMQTLLCPSYHPRRSR